MKRTLSILCFALFYSISLEAKINCDSLWKKKPEDLIFAAAGEYIKLQINGLNGLNGINKSCIDDSRFTVINPYFNSYSGFLEQGSTRESLQASDIERVVIHKATPNAGSDSSKSLTYKEFANIALRAKPTDATVKVEGVVVLKNKSKKPFSFAMSPVARKNQWQKYGCLRLVEMIQQEFTQPVNRKLASSSCLHPEIFKVK
ncbi:MAG: hypothetical protein COT74_06045 [Bdellovibrionales bacterium CG10_big_fil_rev_8_21_14_0_10_45_34]|nr:MAG: hypothetical protein COT74_06045 [Bdellovibrionales bacterium CG10_big_fil_rev_8_21_14_0_10_45_34]